MHFGWVTADEWYAEKPAFVEGLEESQLRFVLEIPKNLMDGCASPAAMTRQGERCRTWSRSRPTLDQEWVEYHLKDTDAGPMVWEVRGRHSG